MYIYIYICIYTHTHIYKYIHRDRLPDARAGPAVRPRHGLRTPHDLFPAPHTFNPDELTVMLRTSGLGVHHLSRSWIHPRFRFQNQVGIEGQAAHVRESG